MAFYYTTSGVRNYTTRTNISPLSSATRTTTTGSSPLNFRYTLTSPSYSSKQSLGYGSTSSYRPWANTRIPETKFDTTCDSSGYIKRTSFVDLDRYKYGSNGYSMRSKHNQDLLHTVSNLRSVKSTFESRPYTSSGYIDIDNHRRSLYNGALDNGHTSAQRPKTSLYTDNPRYIDSPSHYSSSRDGYYGSSNYNDQDYYEENLHENGSSHGNTESQSRYTYHERSSAPDVDPMYSSSYSHKEKTPISHGSFSPYDSSSGSFTEDVMSDPVTPTALTYGAKQQYVKAKDRGTESIFDSKDRKEVYSRTRSNYDDKTTHGTSKTSTTLYGLHSSEDGHPESAAVKHSVTTNYGNDATLKESDYPIEAISNSLSTDRNRSQYTTSLDRDPKSTHTTDRTTSYDLSSLVTDHDRKPESVVMRHSAPRYNDNDDKLRERDERIEDLTKRLSDEMSTKLSREESSLENVSIKTRPVNICSEYETVCTVEWHNAKCELDQQCGHIMEEDRVHILRDVLLESEENAKVILTSLMEKVQGLLCQPIVHVTGTQQRSNDSTGANSQLQASSIGANRQLSDKLKVQLGDSLRKTAEQVDVSGLAQTVKENVTKTHTKDTKDQNSSVNAVLQSQSFADYFESSARLAWKMELQRPPMTFKQTGTDHKWNKDVQEVYWGSSDPGDPLSLVKYYIHPALYHGDTLMKKGNVYLAKY